ncbi:hypothetical protein [Shewanella sp.]|uniref:hypothetical protein n=1 Tax=Shewanella sp. TaxID=50422 RepID=UPI0035628BA6
MEKAAYLDAMGIARWREAGKSAPLSPELMQALSSMLEHPFFTEHKLVEVKFHESQNQKSAPALELVSRLGDTVTLPLAQMATPEGKRALWHALCHCEVLA